MHTIDTAAGKNEFQAENANGLRKRKQRQKLAKCKESLKIVRNIGK